MIESMNQLILEMDKGQQIEKKFNDCGVDKWLVIDVGGFMLKSLISLVDQDRLRVKQVKQ